jgi:hypothetical protein
MFEFADISRGGYEGVWTSSSYLQKDFAYRMAFFSSDSMDFMKVEIAVEFPGRGMEVMHGNSLGQPRRPQSAKENRLRTADDNQHAEQERMITIVVGE